MRPKVKKFLALATIYILSANVITAILFALISSTTIEIDLNELSISSPANSTEAANSPVALAV